MFKLIIVDDEQPSLRSLENMIHWPDMSISQVETYLDPATAIEAEKKFQADIIITDINMPGINGIELIRSIRRWNPTVQAIFISGYDFFKYAKEALELDAVEYILKPVNRQELANAILAATTRIANRLDNTKKLNLLDTALVQSLPLIESRMLQDIIYGIADTFGIFSNLDQYICAPEQGDSICLLLCDIDSPNAVDEFAMLTIMRKMSELAKELNIMSYGIMISPVGNQRMAILTFAFSKISLNEFTDNIAHYCRNIISASRDRLGIVVTIAFSKICYSIHELPQSYDICRRSIEKKIFLGRGIIIEPQPEQDSDQPMLFLEGIDDELAKTIAIGDTSKLEYLLDNLFDRITSTCMGSKSYIQGLFLNILSRVSITMMEMGMDVRDGILSQELINRILMLETISDVKKWLKDLLIPLNEEIASKRNDNSKRILSKLSAFIEKNYMKEVSLLDFASEIGYSTNHAGFLIKKACGKSFGECLMEARMKKASAIIKSTNMHIYEVANSVGYNSIPAFLKNFKKIYKVTPSEYKLL